MKLFDAINNISKHVGYIYLFRYVSEGEDLVKIGVSNKPKKRFLQVKSALPGKLIYWGAFPVWSPYIIEGILHRKYAAMRQSPQYAAPGAGSNEFFRIGYLQGWLLLLRLQAKSFITVQLAIILPIITIILWLIGPEYIADLLIELSSATTATSG